MRTISIQRLARSFGTDKKRWILYIMRYFILIHVRLVLFSCEFLFSFLKLLCNSCHLHSAILANIFFNSNVILNSSMSVRRKCSRFPNEWFMIFLLLLSYLIAFEKCKNLTPHGKENCKRYFSLFLMLNQYLLNLSFYIK